MSVFKRKNGVKGIAFSAAVKFKIAYFKILFKKSAAAHKKTVTVRSLAAVFKRRRVRGDYYCFFDVCRLKKVFAEPFVPVVRRVKRTAVYRDSAQKNTPYKKIPTAFAVGTKFFRGTTRLRCKKHPY